MAGVDGFFLPLARRLSSVIERNVSVERLSEAKRLALALHVDAGRSTALALGCTPEQGGSLATALFALMLGVTEALAAPDVDLAAFPADVQPLLVGEDPTEAFVRMGSWLVAGSGASPAPAGAER